MGTNSQIFCEALTVTPIIFEDEGTVVIFREGGSIALDDVNGTPTVPAISVTNGQQILAFLEGGTIGTLSGGPAAVPVIDFTVPGSFHIIFQLVNSRGGIGIIDNIIQADPTTTFINGHDQTANLGDQTAFFAGALIDNPIALSQWMSWESGDTASAPATAQTGRQRFNTDLKTGTAFDGFIWQQFARKKASTVGDGVSTQIDVPHDLNTLDVQVEVYTNASPWDTISPPACVVERLDPDTVRLTFIVAPAVDEFRVVITG